MSRTESRIQETRAYKYYTTTGELKYHTVQYELKFRGSELVSIRNEYKHEVEKNSECYEYFMSKYGT